MQRHLAVTRDAKCAAIVDVIFTVEMKGNDVIHFVARWKCTRAQRTRPVLSSPYHTLFVDGDFSSASHARPKTFAREATDRRGSRLRYPTVF